MYRTRSCETKISVRSLVWIFVIIGISTLMVILLSNASATTIYVDDSGGRDYTTINDAINAASAGDTVYVYDGIYNENFLISKQINLVGESNQSTIIMGVGNPNDPGIAITSNYVSVSYLRIENFGCGIFASPSSNTNIIYTTITDSIIWGAYIEGDNNIVSGNTIINCKNSGAYSDPSIPKESYGISVTGNNNIFTSNVITNISSSKKSYGIYGRGSYNVFSYNKITDIKDSQGFNSEGMDLYGTGNVISYNTINNNDYSIGIVGTSTYNDILQNTLTNSTYGAIIFGTYHTIKFNNLMNSGTMILQGENTISDNTVNNKPLLYYKNINATASPQVLDNVDANGIILYNCSGFKIKNSGIDCGSIILDTCSNIEIESNNISSKWFGVLVFGGSNNTIVSNTIMNGGDGIYLRAGTEKNTITRNALTGQRHSGIKVDLGSNNNISMNNIYSNKEYGLYVCESAGTGNTAFNNWWGSVSGPYNATSNPNGMGDNVSGIAQYSPWVTSYLNFSPPSASPKTITVDDSGGKDYTKIQDAINVAQPGDSVYVYNGIYQEQITVYKGINIVGESNQNTIIKGSDTPNSAGIYVIVDNVDISNITVDSFDRGIYIYQSSNDNVTSNIITNSNKGVSIYFGSDNNIESNRIINTGIGVSLSYSSSNTIKTNVITSDGYYENDSGLVGFWPMDEDSGTTVLDKSGSGNTGTLTNGPTWIDGGFGKALRFDGSDDCVNAGTINIPYGSQARTYEAWINLSGVGGCIIGTNGGGDGQRYYIEMGSTGSNWYLFSDGYNDANNIVITGDEIPPSGRWSHIAFVLDGSNNWKYFLDGILKKSGTFSVPINTGTPTSITIGTRTDSSFHFNGVIDEVRIYNRELTADEIKAHYVYYTSAFAFGTAGVSLTFTSNDNNLISNTITSFTNGVSISSGSGNNIVYNNITNSSNVGVSLSSTSRNNIASNTLTNNSLGVSLSYSSNNTIKTNIIEKTSGGYYENYTRLVGFWSMDEGSGTAVLDKSGNGNAGTLIDGPTWIDGKFGKALRFDGSNDYVYVGKPVPSTLKIQNELTLEAWIYVIQYPASSDLGLIVGCRYDAGTDGYAIHLDGRTNSDGQTSPAGHIHFQIGDSSSWHATNVNAQVPLNQWVHIVATRRANEDAKVYYNGVLQPSISIAWSGVIAYNPNQEFAIGRQADSASRYFNGIVDEVKIYNRALTQDEIKAQYAHYATNAGISLSFTSNDNDVAFNTITNGTNGISICFSSDNNITSNIVTNNNNTGMFLSLASNNNITSNTITNNSNGVSFSSGSNNNTIVDNTIARNENSGIILQSSSGNNITLNNIYSNKQYGLYSDTSTGNNASNNWWGDPNGPHDQTANPNGTGDNIVGSTTDTSWVRSKINHPPVVAAISNKTAFAGTEFVFQINAIDMDEDVLRYTDNTEIFEIDSTTGLIEFTPLNTKKGNYAITISVSDGTDTTNTTFNLSIPNRAPHVEPIVNQIAFVETEFMLYVNATDMDNDILTYADNSPLVAIDSTSGLIEFTPLNTNKGNYAITISVSDGTDTTNTTFNLSIPNRAPHVEPIVNQIAFVGTEFTLYVNATDTDNDVLTYAGDSSLFTIGSTTGLIKFTPSNTDKGNHTVTISVNDGTDTTTKTFNLSIPNRPPVIATIVNQTVEVGVRFTYQVNATDADNDTLIFTSNIGNITNTGMFSYISNITGLYHVSITVNDTYQSTTASFILSIEVQNRAPVIVSPISQNAIVGRWFIYRINATDADNDTLTYTDNTSLFIINQTTGMISFIPSVSEIGRHNVTIFVSDGKKIVNTTFILNVNNASNTPPSLKITSEFSDVISRTIKITGTASDDFLVRYVQIRIDSGEWINATDNASWSYYLDTTTLTNGEHKIDVRAYDGEFYSVEETLNIVVSNSKEENKGLIVLGGNELLMFLAMGVVVPSVIFVMLYLRRKKKRTTDAVVRQQLPSDVAQTNEAKTYPEQHQQYAYPEGYQQTGQYPAPPYPEGYPPYPQGQYPPEQYSQDASQQGYFTQTSEQPQYDQYGDRGEGQSSASPQKSYPSSKQMYVCPFCGKEVTYDESVCPHCGNPIRREYKN